MLNRGPLIRAAQWMLAVRSAFHRAPRPPGIDPFDLAWPSDIGRVVR
jgi:hypothetical protein